VDLPVAAEGVSPLILWASVHIEYERISLAGIEGMRLDDEDLNLGSAGAIDPDRFCGPNVDLGGDTGVDVGERGYITRLAIRDGRAVDLCGIPDRPARENQPPVVTSELEPIYSLVGEDLGDDV